LSADPPKTVPSSGGKVPLVSEVLERLVAELGGEASRRPAFFQAALQVCSEELRSVKGGGRAASLEELVARARKLLGAPAAKPPAAAPPAPPAPAPRVRPPSAAAPVAPSLPFPEEEPTKQHTLPAAGPTAPSPEPVAPPAGLSEDDLFTIDESPDVTAVAARRAPPPVAPAASAPPPAVPPPIAAPAAAPPSPVPPGTTTPPAFARPAPPPLPRAHDEQPLPIAAPAVRDLFGSLADHAQPPLETPTDDHLRDSFGPAHLEPYGHDAESPRSRRTLLGIALGGTLLVAAVVVALWRFGGGLRDSVLPRPPVAAPTHVATPRYQSVFEPDATPGTEPRATPRPAATGAAEPTRAPLPTPAPTAPAPPPEPARRLPSVSAQAAVMVSPDWAGRPPAYAIHFSSYQDRARAEADAARIGAAYGHPAAVAAVDLGGRGRWHRVMLTGFADYREARAFHDRLRAQGTPGLGGVYYLVAPE
jgi:hypothetical protein